MSIKSNGCGVVVFLSLFFFLFKCFGDDRKKTFDETILGCTKYEKRLGHVTFFYQLERLIDSEYRVDATGWVLTDQVNIRHHFTRYDERELHFETVVAPEWDRYVEVGRDSDGELSTSSCLSAENIPNIFQTLGGPVNFPLGRLSFHGREFTHLSSVLQELEPSDVAIVGNTQNQRELRFSQQGYQYRILLDGESFAVVLFEKNTLLPRSRNYETESYVLEVSEFQDIGGVKFPVRYTTVLSLSGESGKTTYRWSLSDISFNVLAEKDFRLTITIPDGTHARMNDASHIQHIWHDGKIVPKTDDVMLAIARGGHKFMPGPKEPRFWLMVIGIFLILLGGGRMAYRHFTNKA